jgi:lipopolysaccharide transport system permease protein
MGRMAMSAAQIKASGLLAPVTSALRNRSLIAELSKRDVLGRYRGASFGLLWSLISPFLMLCVYTFAFGNILSSRWPQQAGTKENSYAIILFVGLIIHGFFAECLTRSPHLITGNSSYVKRVIFPLDILPWPMMFSALFHALMNVVVFVALRLLLEHTISWTLFLLPLVILPLAVLMLGIGWLLAALGVYFRDVSQMTGVLATAMLFTSSAVVPVSSVSPKYRVIFESNPLTFIIDQARAVALWNTMPDWAGLGIYLLVSLAVAYLSYAWFMATKRGFGDVV